VHTTQTSAQQRLEKAHDSKPSAKPCRSIPVSACFEHQKHHEVVYRPVAEAEPACVSESAPAWNPCWNHQRRLEPIPTRDEAPSRSAVARREVTCGEVWSWGGE